MSGDQNQQNQQNQNKQKGGGGGGAQVGITLNRNMQAGNNLRDTVHTVVSEAVGYIAAAVVKTLDKPKTHVSVPPPLRFTAQAAQMLPPRGRRWLNKKLGLDTVFLEFDSAKRKSYEDRAQAAQGVIES